MFERDTHRLKQSGRFRGTLPFIVDGFGGHVSTADNITGRGLIKGHPE